MAYSMTNINSLFNDKNASGKFVLGIADASDVNILGNSQASTASFITGSLFTDDENKKVLRTTKVPFKAVS